MTIVRIALMLAVAILAGGCTGQPTAIGSPETVVFLTRGGCVDSATMKANLDDALRLLGQPPAYQVVDLDTLPDGDVRRGYPTPTVLVATRDLFGMAEPQPPYPTPT